MWSEKSNQGYAFIILRFIVAIIIASHGWHRLLSGGYEPFGQWLTGRGFPFGLALAWGVTLVEVLGSPILAWGKKLPYLCNMYIGIYFTGLVLVHWQHGWFVVGSGSNGIEYSVLLIAALICIGYPQIGKPANQLNS
ncbi:hypothetical protein tinsulaeT_06560 [Thalassotalea insulae]|uniref:DoxX family protein n=1 Tax=Thalassotalea insulae TaxID=2056778 RepID=A0ABQ6GT37_9GAMM|nr:DoxX family protein [Thalassotalea insulae]GLX77316.1 hypothetical protein tinsulaeT_06560 [Thalassotalea insulae]